MNCPAPSCTAEIAPTSTSCFRHWSALPRSLRDKIRRQANFFGPGEPHEHNLAVQMAKAQRIWNETQEAK